jgi:hypothetical protein
MAVQAYIGGGAPATIEMMPLTGGGGDEWEGGAPRFTLRNCHAFHAPYELPGVAFYVPKPFVARGGGTHGRRPRVERFPAEAFMARGDPTLMLALDVGNTVSLTPRERVSRAPSRGSSGNGGVGGSGGGGRGAGGGGEEGRAPRAHPTTTTTTTGRSDKADDVVHEAEGNNTDNSGGTVCVIDAVEMSSSGRSARLELRLLFL